MITMRELMNDPVYRAYVKRVPINAQPHNTSPAYRLWVHTAAGSWLTKQGTYQDLWPVFVRFYRENNAEPTITSLRTFYAPPGEWRKVRVRLDKPRLNAATGELTTHRVEERWRQTFHWDDYRAEWCGRCRRPVQFIPLFETHHALKRWPVVSDEDNIRCPICGIRRSAQPPISHMVKL